MSATLQFSPNNAVCEIHIHGVLRRSDFKSCEDQLATLVEKGAEPRILVVLEDFEGWERANEWNNLEFMFSHGDKIARIAVVGDARWEGQVKMFTGAGMRRTPVGYFTEERLEDARSWVLT